MKSFKGRMRPAGRGLAMAGLMQIMRRANLNEENSHVNFVQDQFRTKILAFEFFIVLLLPILELLT